MYAGQGKEAKPLGEGDRELWTKSLQGAESGR